MDHFSRRSLITAVAGGGLALWLPDWICQAVAQAPALSPALLPPPVHTRYSATSPQGKAMLSKYATAVDRMMKLVPKGDPRNWEFQWYTHWIPGPNGFGPWPPVEAKKTETIQQVYQGKPPSDPHRKLAEAMWDNCQSHGFNPNLPSFFEEMLFCPWHRYFVYYFEQIIRVVIGDASFTLPYWDYLSGNVSDLSIPPEFRDPQSPLFRPNRNPWVNAGERIDKQNPGSLNLDAFQESSYIKPIPNGNIGFCPVLDRNPHGLVHVYVGNGTNMGSVPTAAGDPIFWLHHSNIDRLWESWNRLNHANPPWPARNFPFANGAGGAVTAPVAGADRVALLHYRYETYQVPAGLTEPLVASAPFSASAPAAQAALEAPLEVRAIAEEPLKLGAAPLRVALTSPAAPLATATPLAAAPEPLQVLADRNYYLLLGDINVQADPGAATYNVYFDLPEGAAAPSTEDPTYVGTLNFFGAAPGHGHSEGGEGHAAVFNVTAAVKRLQAAGKLSGTPTVTLVPQGEGHDQAKPTIGELSLVED
jgi:tyrosinase